MNCNLKAISSFITISTVIYIFQWEDLLRVNLTHNVLLVHIPLQWSPVADGGGCGLLGSYNGIISDYYHIHPIMLIPDGDGSQMASRH